MLALTRHDLVREKGTADACCATCGGPIWFNDGQPCLIRPNGSALCSWCMDQPQEAK